MSSELVQDNLAGPNSSYLLTEIDDLLADSHALRRALETVSVPHTFDVHSLDLLLDEDLKESKDSWLDQLLSLSFITPLDTEGAYAVHEATRLAIRERLFLQEPERLRLLAGRAIDVFQGSSTYAEVERAYHFLIASSPDAEVYLDELDYRLSGLDEGREALARALEEYGPDSIWPAQARGWALLIKSRAGLNRRGTDSTATYSELQSALRILWESPYGRLSALIELGSLEQEIRTGFDRRVVAQRHLESACYIARGHSKLSPAAHWRLKLVKALSSLGWLIARQDVEKAMESWEEALGVANHLAWINKNNPRFLELLAGVHNRIGRYAEKKDFHESIAEALSVLLARRDPWNIRLQRLVFLALWNRGSKAIELKEWNTAADSVAYARAITISLLDRNPNNWEAKRDLAFVDQLEGTLALERGDVEIALQKLIDAERVARDAAESDTRQLQWQEEAVNRAYTLGDMLLKKTEEAHAIRTLQAGLSRAIALYKGLGSVEENNLILQPIVSSWRADRTDIAKRLIQYVRHEEPGYTSGLMNVAVLVEDADLLRELIADGGDLNERNQNGLTALQVAAVQGHGGIVGELLFAGASPDLVDKNGNTALHLAAQRGHEGVVHLLLAGAAGFEVQNGAGLTALQMAAVQGHGEIVEELLVAGASPDLADTSGNTALHLAAGQGHEKVVGLLLAAGASFKLQNKAGATALDMAVRYPAVIDRFLEYGAPLPAAVSGAWLWIITNASEGTPRIHRLEGEALRSRVTSDLAITNREWPLQPLIPGAWRTLESIEAIDILCRLGESGGLIDARAVTRVRVLPLTFYPDCLLAEAEVSRGSLSFGLISFLVSPRQVTLLDGTSPPIHRFNRECPLRIETDEQVQRYLRFFCSAVHGEDGPFRLVDRPEQIPWSIDADPAQILGTETPLLPLAFTEKDGGAGQPDRYLSGTVQYGPRFFSATFLVRSTGTVEMIEDTQIQSRLPVRFEVFINRVRVYLRSDNSIGRYAAWPLMGMVVDGDLTAISLLLEQYAPVNLFDDSGRTALFLASLYQRPDVIRMLLNAAARTDVRDRDGLTALQMAAVQGHGEIVEELLVAGASPDLADTSGNTALHLAAGQGHEKVVGLLLAAGASFKLQNKAGATALDMAVRYPAVIDRFLEYGAPLPAAVSGAWLWIITNASEGTPRIHRLEGEALRSRVTSDLAITNREWPLQPLIPGAWRTLESIEAIDILCRLGESGGLIDARAVTRVRVLPLTFYPDCLLAEAEVSRGSLSFGLISFLVSPRQVTLLDGTSPPIHRFNRECPLRIETDEQVQRYLRFFCSAVHGEDGPFRLVDRPEQIPWSIDADPAQILGTETPLLPLAFTEKDGGAGQPDRYLSGTVQYGPRFFSATFLVRSTGAVEMIEDTQVQSRLPVRFEAFINRVRVLSQELRTGLTALQMAAVQGHGEIVEELLVAGASPDLADTSGNTALHLAAGQGHEKVVGLLLAAGASFKLQNKAGATALDMAVRYPAVIDRFLEYGAPLPAAVSGAWLWIITNASEGTPRIHRLEGEALRSRVTSDLAITNREWPLQPLIPGAWRTLESIEAIDILCRLGESGGLIDARAVTRVRVLPLTFYPDCLLAEAEVSRGSLSFGLISFLVSPRQVTLLDGTSPPIHRFNRECPLRIETDEQVQRYLRFFCSAVHGEDGPFRLVDRPEQIPWSIDADPAQILGTETPLLPLAFTEKDGGAGQPDRYLSGTVQYGLDIYSATFLVRSTGEVIIIEDTQVQYRLPVRFEFVESAVRILLSPALPSPLQTPFKRSQLRMQFLSTRSNWVGLPGTSEILSVVDFGRSYLDDTGPKGSVAPKR